MRRAPVILGGAPIPQRATQRNGRVDAAIEDHVEARPSFKRLPQRIIQILMAALNDDAEGSHVRPEYRRLRKKLQRRG